MELCYTYTQILGRTGRSHLAVDRLLISIEARNRLGCSESTVRLHGVSLGFYTRNATAAASSFRMVPRQVISMTVSSPHRYTMQLVTVPCPALVSVGA